MMTPIVIKDRMRLLIITHWSMKRMGGVPSHIAFLMKALDQAGYDYVFLNPDQRFWSLLWKFIAFVRGYGIDGGRVALNRFRMANLRRKITKQISRQSFDLVHAHDVLSGQVALDLGLPVVVTVHGPLSREGLMLFGNQSPRYQRFALECEHSVYTRAARIIAVDSGQRDIVLQFGTPIERVRVILNAVDTDLFAPPFSAEGGKPYLLVPRRLVKKNGVDVAIRALHYMRDISVELWIAGEGTEERVLRKLAFELGVQDRVHFFGSVSDRTKMVSLMGRARAVIIPSVPVAGVIEATSIAALEAMSVGAPVLASRIGGLTEIITEGETGFLFEAGNEKALASLMEFVLDEENGEVLQRIKHEARKHVIANHSLGPWFNQVRAVYKAALD